MVSLQSIMLSMINSSSFQVEEVMLFDLAEISKLSELQTKLRKSADGQLNLGFFGSPEWVGGGILAVSALNSLIRLGKEHHASELIQSIDGQVRRVIGSGRYFPVEKISGLEGPHPENWVATVEETVMVDDPADIRKREDLQRRAPGWFRGPAIGEVRKIEQNITRNFVFFGGDFVAIKSNKREFRLRWSHVTTYSIANDDMNDII
ncbi:hypothetical protein [Enterovirga rhinocerotis]|uniref:hypothetical protein n=1 Tax=Enterovirga rhinocerotis TaxID=1339210 RepID=UPI00105C2FE4|nr:hypothetical protein [Enterovirga rhinocerotis]